MAGHVLQSIGYRGDVQIVTVSLCFQRLGEKEETVKSEVLSLVNRLKARFGRSRRCEAPEVNNRRRGPGRRGDLSKQGIVVVALAGSEAEFSLTQDPELGPGLTVITSWPSCFSRSTNLAPRPQSSMNTSQERRPDISRAGGADTERFHEGM